MKLSWMTCFYFDLKSPCIHRIGDPLLTESVYFFNKNMIQLLKYW